MGGCLKVQTSHANHRADGRKGSQICRKGVKIGLHEAVNVRKYINRIPLGLKIGGGMDRGKGVLYTIQLSMHTTRVAARALTLVFEPNPKT